MTDRQETKSHNETGSGKDRDPAVKLFDPWDRQLRFDRQSRLLSPVHRERRSDPDDRAA